MNVGLFACFRACRRYRIVICVEKKRNFRGTAREGRCLHDGRSLLKFEMSIRCSRVSREIRTAFLHERRPAIPGLPAFDTPE
jgi:hypothetical protein